MNAKKWKFLSISLAAILLAVILIFSTFSPIGIYKTPDKTVIVVGQLNTVEASGTTQPDFVTNGSNDNIAFQAALNSLPDSGGKIQVLSGTYQFSATVSRTINNVIIEGVGAGCLFNYDASHALFSVGSQTGWVFRDIKTDAGKITNSANALLENVTLGTDYIAYQLPSAATSADFITDVTGDITGSISGGTVAGSSVTDSGLTSGRVPYASTGGLLADDSGLSYNAGTDTLTTTNLTAPTGRSASYVIAASDAPAIWKAQADYVMPSASADLGAIVNTEKGLGYQNIHLSQGNFKQDTAFDFDDTTIMLTGSGIDITIITCATSITAFDVSKASVVTEFNHIVRDLTITGTTGDTAITFAFTQQTRWENVKFKAFPTVMTFGDDSYHHRFVNCFFNNCGNGSTSAFIFNNAEQLDTWFENCTWEDISGDMFEATASVGGLYFTNPKAERHTGNFTFIKTTGSGKLDYLQINNGIICQGDTPINITGDNCSIIGTNFVRTSVQDVIIVGNNNLVQVSDITAPRQGYTNLLANGSFENTDPPATWTSAGEGATFSRSNAQVKLGTYSGLITRSGADAFYMQNIANPASYVGSNLTFGCWVYATVASRAYIQITTDSDGGKTVSSSIHSGGSSWEWLTTTIHIGTVPSYIQARPIVASGNTTAYFDGAMMVEGYSVPEFSPMPASATTE